MHSIYSSRRRTCQLDIFLVAIGSISYLILIQQDHLGVYYKYLCYYNRHFSDILFLCTLVSTVQKVCKIAENTKCENIKSSFLIFCKNQLQQRPIGCLL